LAIVTPVFDPCFVEQLQIYYDTLKEAGKFLENLEKSTSFSQLPNEVAIKVENRENLQPHKIQLQNIFSPKLPDSSEYLFVHQFGLFL